VCLVSKGGSRYETAPGASVLLEHMAFSASGERSALKIARDMENAGWGVGQVADRESLIMSLKVFPGEEADAVKTLAESATSSLFRGWEVDEMKTGRLGYNLTSASTSAEVQLSEAVHAAAFLDSKPLGKPYMNKAAASVSTKDLTSFAETVFSPDNMVLSAAGVDHASLVAAAEAAFGSVKSAGALSAESAYRGGEVRVKTAGGDSYVSLAFEGAAAGSNADILVLEKLINAEGVTGFSTGYSDTGLVGAYGSCAAGAESELVASMVSALKGVAGGVDAKAFNAAKASASLGAVVDDSASLAESLGTSTLYSGSASAGVSFDSVTASTVAAAAKKALASNPSLASVGSLLNMPGVEDVKKML